MSFAGSSQNSNGFLPGTLRSSARGSCSLELDQPKAASDEPAKTMARSAESFILYMQHLLSLVCTMVFERMEKLKKRGGQRSCRRGGGDVLRCGS
jgi:hypothetical protein